jgi:hypothetical protein
MAAVALAGLTCGQNHVSFSTLRSFASGESRNSYKAQTKGSAKIRDDKRPRVLESTFGKLSVDMQSSSRRREAYQTANRFAAMPVLEGCSDCEQHRATLM